MTSSDLSEKVEAFQREVQVGDAHAGSHWGETLSLPGELLVITLIITIIMIIIIIIMIITLIIIP